MDCPSFSMNTTAWQCFCPEVHSISLCLYTHVGVTVSPAEAGRNGTHIKTLMLFLRRTVAMRDLAQDEWAPTWPADESEFWFCFGGAISWLFSKAIQESALISISGVCRVQLVL